MRRDKGGFMKHECKITVLETKVFPELQDWRYIPFEALNLEKKEANL